MIKYTGPRIKIIRRLGSLPGLSNKVNKNLKTPGQHGKLLYTKIKRAALSEDYKQRLLEKQKVRFNYGINEKQLLAYYKKAKRKKGTTGTLLFQLLESRLDCLVYRFGFAPTILAARQLINHQHILVNEKLINIPSFICHPNDFITIKNSEKSKRLISKFLETIEQKRRLIIRRSKLLLTRKLGQLDKQGKRKFKKLLKISPIKTLLPEHLALDSQALKGQYISSIKKNNMIIRIDDLKLIEYYSR
jgi:small subunit ribosomal protein S4